MSDVPGSGIYLDYAASTPLDPRVGRVLVQQLDLANPAATHAAGRQAATQLAAARHRIGEGLGVSPESIVFTSGATEGANLALFGAARALRGDRRHLITSAIEHRAVLDACGQLRREGWQLTCLPPDSDGRIDPSVLKEALRPDTALVSLMHVNNETGAINDIATLGEYVRAHGALFHVDAAQSVGKLPLDLARLHVDLLSFSAHKLYGPMGIGALVRRHRPRLDLQPLLYGGGQQRGIRPGTEPVALACALAAALQFALDEQACERERLRRLGDKLRHALEGLDGVVLNGPRDPAWRWPGILNLSFAGISGDALLAACPQLALASGSACTAASNEASHVLRAMALEPWRLECALRISFGRFTTREQIDTTIAALSAAVHRLRALSPEEMVFHA